MKKEKQIEEMAKDIGDSIMFDDFDFEMHEKTEIIAKRAAEKMAVKGYLKQSYGRWYVERVLNRYASRIGRNVFIKVFCCSVCGKSNGLHRNKYCPNCGAKMKGV